ncbi:E3 ubiquitin-protein ligase XIAP-like [Antedon mediterranea]|uniref:E3 ubiquitin-protein ligase XIAP-like n=1 Tax=Antedon mediterranea TaxID=105859 RepID=UPI003AF4AAF2
MLLLHERLQAGDVADVVHGKFSPTCEFLSQKLAKANRSSTGSNDAVVKNKTKKQNAENAHEPFPRSSTSSLPDKMSSLSVLPSPPPTSPPPMSSYVARLAYYKNWPIQNVVSSISLARSGFYYTGTDDHVKCFSCMVGLKGWEEGDVADVEHGKFNRTCEFLSQKRKEANRSSTSSNDAVVTRVEIARMSSLWSRLATYKNWLAKKNGVAPYSSMARSGFYYTGVGDCVECFCCRGRLKGLKSGDNVEQEHERLYPHCGYLPSRCNAYRVDDSTTNKQTSSSSSSVLKMCYPKFADLYERRRTFARWKIPAAGRIAEAGFFAIDVEAGRAACKIVPLCTQYLPHPSSLMLHTKHKLSLFKFANLQISLSEVIPKVLIFVEYIIHRVYLFVPVNNMYYCPSVRKFNFTSFLTLKLLCI